MLNIHRPIRGGTAVTTEIPFLFSKELISSIRHGMDVYNQALTEPERKIFQADARTRRVLRLSADEIDKIVGQLFTAYHLGTVSKEAFANSYGVWMRVKKTVAG